MSWTMKNIAINQTEGTLTLQWTNIMASLDTSNGKM